MSNLSPLGERRLGDQSDDGVSQVTVGADESAATVKKPLSPKDAARVGYIEEEEDGFIHEPEEQFALLDPRIYLKILFPGLISEMATREETTQLESREESCSKQELHEFKNGEAMNENESKMYSDSTKKKYSMDADILDAISGFPNHLGSDLVLKRVLTPEASREDKTQQDVDSTAGDNSVVEYWSDEEYRYPPQMSLSPPPGQFRRIILAAKKCEEKEEENANENEKQWNLEKEKNKEIKHHEDCPETHFKKRALKKALSPIVIRKEHYNHQDIARVTETTTGISPTSPTAHQYIWKQRTPANEQEVSSPSLVRPTLITTPTINKENYLSCNELIFSPRNSRMNDNKLSIDSKRSMMPKRQVSRSYSSQTASASTMFPEIPTISKTQGSSISDFRQSSSIFGRLVKKNAFNGTLDDRGKSKAEKERNKDIQQSTKTPARNSNMGESAKRKIRRILSLN